LGWKAPEITPPSASGGQHSRTLRNGRQWTQKESGPKVREWKRKKKVRILVETEKHETRGTRFLERVGLKGSLSLRFSGGQMGTTRKSLVEKLQEQREGERTSRTKTGEGRKKALVRESKRNWASCELTPRMGGQHLPKEGRGKGKKSAGQRNRREGFGQIRI